MCYFSTTYNIQYYLQNRKILTSKNMHLVIFSLVLLSNVENKFPTQMLYSINLKNIIQN